MSTSSRYRYRRFRLSRRLESKVTSWDRGRQKLTDGGAARAIRLLISVSAVSTFLPRLSLRNRLAD